MIKATNQVLKLSSDQPKQDVYSSSSTSNVVKNESQHLGSHHLTCHNTSTVLRFHFGSVLLCFSVFFAIFPLSSLFFAIFSLFPLFCCLVPLFSVFPLLSLFLCWFLCFSSIFPIYFSKFRQQPTDPTHEPCYVSRVYVLSQADRSYLGY